MKRLTSIIVTAALGAVAFGTVFATPARAGCGSFENSGAVWRLPSSISQPGGFGLVLAKFPADNSASDASMVGFWRVEFTADGDTAPFDTAYAQWHSDGTEIMNSSRDPRTQSFCLGVWKRTGAFSYTLKHLAMSWDGAGHPVGPAAIFETVTLGQHGDTFKGTFVLTQYQMDGTTVIPPTPITGTLAGTRITPD